MAVDTSARGFVDRLLKGDIEHHGVKGQKWGVRRSRKERAAASEDSARVSTHKATIKTSGVRALSNKELQDVVTRMNLEQQYGRLSAANKSKGRKLAESILGDIAKKQVRDLATEQADVVAATLKNKGN